jgi:hypothetical protein
MPIATAELEGQGPTKQEIEDLKAKITALYADYGNRRYELGMRLIQLQGMLAHPHSGNFLHVATVELKIPHSTVYDLIAYAKSESERLRKANLAGNRLDPENTEVDLSDPDEIEHLLELFQAEAERVGDLEYRDRPPKKPKPYKKEIQLRLTFDYDTRIAVHRAWKVVKRYKGAYEKLCYKLAKEVIRAGTKIEAMDD